MSHFSKGLCRRDLGQIEMLDGNRLVGVIFFWRDLKTSCIKNSEYEFQTKKKDSNCNFYNFSLLVPYRNIFLVVCICILIFHSMYIRPLPTSHPQIFFIVGVNFFLYFVARSWEKFKFLADLLYWGNLISFFGRRGLGSLP